MTFTISVFGVRETKQFLQNKNKAFVMAVNRGLGMAGAHIESEVKQSVAGRKAEMRSVDTGRFLNSIISKPVKDGVSVETNLEYAPFLEYGTTRGLKARKHFENTKNREKQKVVGIVKREVSKA